MGPLVIAWLIGEGIVTYRWAKAGAPPTPGTLAAASGFFVLTAILAEYQPARGLATLLAFGVDIAALLQVLPGGNPAQQTGWPPLKINDPAVFLPKGSSGGGNIQPEGGNALQNSGAAGGTGPGGVPAVSPGSTGRSATGGVSSRF